jgi:sortase A
VTRVLRGTGWLLVAAGSVVLLYLAYQLVFTNTITAAAQAQLLEHWRLEVDEPEHATATTAPDGHEHQVSTPTAIREGDAVAVLTFRSPGSDELIIHDRPLAVVEGVSPDALKRGPGRYPGTAPPGGAGNFAIAGHRTTYGAPFFHVDRLQPGDLIEAIDRDGRQWTYVVRRQQVVEPDETWTIGPDPLGSGTPLLIVFAELRSY